MNFRKYYDPNSDGADPPVTDNQAASGSDGTATDSSGAATSDSSGTAFDPTTANINDLFSQGQSALTTLSPLATAVTTAQAQLAADQLALQAAMTNQASQLAAVQNLGHQLIQAISAQYFITSTVTGAAG